MCFYVSLCVFMCLCMSLTRFSSRIYLKGRPGGPVAREWGLYPRQTRATAPPGAQIAIKQTKNNDNGPPGVAYVGDRVRLDPLGLGYL